jgi:predicted lipoprotein with Yx(FWY)xxD motif
MKRTMTFAAIAVVTVAVHANPTLINEGLGASKDGRMLYMFDKDAAGKSSCNDGCAAASPPFAVAGYDYN